LAIGTMGLVVKTMLLKKEQFRLGVSNAQKELQ
jgi:hypothetical protein